MNRQQLRDVWLQSLFPGVSFSVTTASADASFRSYFRVNMAGRTLIVMDAPPEHENCLPFIHVAQLFHQAGVHVPQVLQQNLEQGFLLLTDLGDTTYLQALNKISANATSVPQGDNVMQARNLYGAATDALIKIQLASSIDKLPHYDEAMLLREMRLFPDWYIARHLQVTLDEKQSAALNNIFQRILQNNLAQPHVYVHRDYHSRNLMVTTANLNLSANPGILDFQDAVWGPVTYDLVSLFKDAYIHWEEADTLDWLIRYWEKARAAGLPVHVDFAEFYRDYEWVGVQRHLKVLGIFARLYHRDGKDGYLKNLPLVMKYLRNACERYEDLKPLLKLLDTLQNKQTIMGFTV